MIKNGKKIRNITIIGSNKLINNGSGLKVIYSDVISLFHQSLEVV